MPLPAYIDRRRVFGGMWYGPKGPTRPAGQAAGTYIDANGTTAQLDASGRVIHGSVLDSEHSPASDSLFQLSSAMPEALAPKTGGTSTTTSTFLTTRTTVPMLGSLTNAQIGAGLLGVAAIGLIGYAVTRPQAAGGAKKRARANPSRRRRHRRHR